MIFTILYYAFFSVGVVATLLQIAQFLWPDIREKTIRFLSYSNKLPYTIGWNIDILNENIVKARKNVIIVQTWLPTLNMDIGHWRNVPSHVTFQVMLLDEKLVPARLRCRERDNSLTQNNLKNFAHMRNEEPKRDLEVRLYYALPFGPVYIIDDMIFWGIYLSQECSMHGPMFKTHKESMLGQIISNSVYNLWQKASPADLSAIAT